MTSRRYWFSKLQQHKKIQSMLSVGTYQTTDKEKPTQRQAKIAFQFLIWIVNNWQDCGCSREKKNKLKHRLRHIFYRKVVKSERIEMSPHKLTNNQTTKVLREESALTLNDVPTYPHPVFCSGKNRFQPISCLGRMVRDITQRWCPSIRAKALPPWGG